MAQGSPDHADDAPRKADDPYSRVSYRRLIAWDRRIGREGPWLTELLEGGPDRSVLDLGCGTGEHVAFFAGLGARAVGVDLSEAMIDSARDHEGVGNARFLLGAAADAPELLRGERPFGLAICLGNVLPHLLGDDDVLGLVGAAAELLAPGGRLLLQILNYDRLIEQDVRHLPLNFNTCEGGEEIVFLRLLRKAAGGRMLFYPTTLKLDPDAEEPVTVEASRRVELRAWTSRELSRLFGECGLTVALHGDMKGGPFDAASSGDLVMVGTKPASD